MTEKNKDNEEDCYAVEKVLKKRIKNGELQYYLKWKGFPE